MINRKKWMKAKDGVEIFVRIWDDVKNPKAVLQIFHGMAEHSARYDEFAKFFNDNDIIVYADDHRGHGNSLGEEKTFGYIGKDGFNRIVEDEKMISNFIRRKYPDLPLFIFAHSFGSFIGQEYIIRYSEDIDGIILSGSGKQDGLDVKLGCLIATIQNLIFDNKKEAQLIDRLSFGNFNHKIKKPKTKFDWLTRNDEEVNEYLKDDLCGFISSINFYYELFNNLPKLYEMQRLQNITNELPILIVSGAMDPVGKYGESVKDLHTQYVNLNLKNTTVKLFKDGRHELTNETNKKEIFKFISNWLTSQIKKEH